MNNRRGFQLLICLLMFSMVSVGEGVARAAQVIDLGGGGVCVSIAVDTNRLKLPLTIEIQNPSHFGPKSDHVLTQKNVQIIGLDQGFSGPDSIRVTIKDSQDMPFGLDPSLSQQIVQAISPQIVNGCIDTPEDPGSFFYSNPPRDGEVILTGAPRDGGLFDQKGLDDQAQAQAYYAAVDPTNARMTLDQWKTVNGFDNGDDASAVFLNAGDLGFGRAMHMKRTPVIFFGTDIAYYVTNYKTLDDAIQNVNPIATVAMEYKPRFPFGPRFTKFFVFQDQAGNGVQERVLSADLDGRGEKYVPGLCIQCHGGNRKTLVGGVYPDGGNIGSEFLPFDLETFGYAMSSGHKKSEQEGAFKDLNNGVLGTAPPAAVRELVEAWYGGPGLPNPIFNGDIVPVGWVGHEDLYNIVVKRSCRSCHIAQGISFDDFTGFEARANGNPPNKSVMQTRTCQQRLATIESPPGNFFDVEVLNNPDMPHANQTFLNFWLSPTPHNGQLLHQPKVLEEELGLINCTTEDRVVGVVGDLDGDSDVDRDDMILVLNHRNEPISMYPDPRDLDEDGTITVADARKLVLNCTRPRCATQ